MCGLKLLDTAVCTGAPPSSLLLLQEAKITPFRPMFMHLKNKTRKYLLLNFSVNLSSEQDAQQRPPSSCHLLKVTLIFCFKFLLNINSFVSPWCWTVVDQSVSGFLLSAPGAEAEDSCFLPPVCHDSLENTQT